MKKLRQTLLYILLFCGFLTSAQDQSRKHSLGLYQVFTDYNVELLNNKVFVFDSSLSHATRLSYQYLLSPSWAVNTGLSNGFILNQDLKDSYVKKAYTIGLDASILYFTNNGRLLKQEARLAPYLGFGYRVEYIKTLKDRAIGPYLMHNQYILGLNIELNPRTHIQLQSAIDQQLDGTFNTHLRYRMGITQSIGPIYESKGKRRILDSDFDGIADSKDECPGRYGLASNGGCPDTSSVEYSERTIALLADLGQMQSQVDSLMLANQQLNASLTNHQLRIQSLEDSLIRCGTITANPSDNGDQNPPVISDPVVPSFSIDLPEGEGYYIVVKSLKETATAEQIKDDLIKDFGNGYLLLQPSGFYRVAVYAGKNYDKAVQLMQHVKAQGYRPVWITKE